MINDSNIVAEYLQTSALHRLSLHWNFLYIDTCVILRNSSVIYDSTCLQLVTYYHLWILWICFLEEVRELPQPRRHYPAHSVADDFLSRHEYNLIFFCVQYELGLINFLKVV